jgi:hypothetical protein
MEEQAMANITGTVMQVFNGNSTGCTIVHDPVANMDEALVFWPGPSGVQNNFRLCLQRRALHSLEQREDGDFHDDHPDISHRGVGADQRVSFRHLRLDGSKRTHAQSRRPEPDDPNANG